MTSSLPAFSLSTSNPTTLKADVIVVCIGAAGGVVSLSPGAKPVAAAYGRGFGDDLAALGATGRSGETTLLRARGSIKAAVVCALGLGEVTMDDAGREDIRRAAGTVARVLAGRGTVVFALSDDDPALVEALAEGALLGAYAFGDFKTSTPSPPVRRFIISTPAARQPQVRAALQRAKSVAEAVHFVRDLVNTPPGHLSPADLASIASTRGRSVGLSVKVWDDAALRRGGFGGITAVGQGSSRGPRLVRLSYRPKGVRAHVALVGKGITFDSGGLSIKPAKAMEWMKTDMGGAAAVLGTTLAAATEKVPVAIDAWLAIAENMPSATAQRPGDVITIYGGKTVEVLNTDAEGRLVLADALTRAQEESPDHVVDIATLTGAQIVALGTHTAGIMANDVDLRDRLHRIADAVGESMWPMPLTAELRPSLDSYVADLANIGDRHGGGMLTAGLFLQEFINPGQSWAHLDIAGPSYRDREPTGYTPKGGTGFGVRTLLGWVRALGSADR